MKMWLLLSLLSLTTTQAFGQVAAFFNQNQRTSYNDPYRNISRRGDNLEAVMIKEISAARKSIYIAVHEFRLPLLAQAVIAKKNQGVDVRIVLENSYNNTVLDQRDSNDQNEHEASKVSDLVAFVDVNRDRKFSTTELETRDAVYMLRQAKIPLIDDTSDGSAGSALMHHKFIIIDGTTVINSTANFTLSCVHGDITNPSSRGNANSLIVARSPQLAKFFTEEFAQLWGNGRRGNYGQRKTYRGPQTANVGGVRITVQFSPTSQRLNWEDSTNGLIGAQLAKATKSIQALLFVFSDQTLADIMQTRFNAGASIGVMMEPKFGYREYSELLDLMGVEMRSPRCAIEPNNNAWRRGTKEAGVAVLPSGDVLHHKFAVVDRKIAIVGSQNWSESANVSNDENVLIIENPTIADQFTQEYNRVKQTASLGVPSWLVQKVEELDRSCASKGKY